MRKVLDRNLSLNIQYVNVEVPPYACSVVTTVELITNDEKEKRSDERRPLLVVLLLHCNKVLKLIQSNKIKKKKIH